MKKIALGSDHAGYELKEAIKQHLIDNGYDVVDCGTNSLDSVDYPVFGEKCARKVANKECDYGIVCCGSGEGISIAANKVPGVRCGIGYNDEVSKLLRQHNDANMIGFGARFMDKDDVLRRVDLFINTKFEGGRHQKRVDLMMDIK